MAIALFLQAIQALMGSQFVVDKLKHNEHVIRVSMSVGVANLKKQKTNLTPLNF
jgi:hypothetical protein